MFVKINKVTSGDKAYFYANIVESYRPAGSDTPKHRVVTKLGRVSETLAKNLQEAFRAADEGRTVSWSEADARELAGVVNHYTFLDVAVLLELWRRWGLDELMDRVAGDARHKMPLSAVTAGLVLHRCVDAASKLEATKWFSRTALPELLRHAPGSFNNTRIHRALNVLAENDDEIQEALSRRVLEMRGDFRALFIDLTDTWFENRGPDLAEQRKTKEGLWRFKVGIALVCTEEGFPIRWKVFPGAQNEAKSVLQVSEWLTEQGYTTDKPLVVDRIMGVLKSISDMKRLSVRYITALRSSTIDHFAQGRDLFSFTNPIDVDAEDAEERAAQLARQEGLKPCRDELFALDLGVVEPTLPDHQRAPLYIEKAQESLKIARALQGKLDTEAATLKAAAKMLGISQPRASTLHKLLQLDDSIQRKIDEGDNWLSTHELQKIARLPHEQQAKRYEQQNESKRKPLPPAIDATSRVIVYFHPRGFVRRRRDAAITQKELERELEELNQRLASPKSRRNIASIEREIRRRLLKPRGLQTHFEIQSEQYEIDGRLAYRVTLRETPAGKRSRERNGFFFLAAHPEVDCTAESLSQLYSDKNIIECDFREIKSSLRLRPVYHHGDPKVRAHVTICMLALLLRRALEHAADSQRTATALLEDLSHVFLNELKSSDVTGIGLHMMTDLNNDQRMLLDRLQMTEITERELPKRLHRR